MKHRFVSLPVRPRLAGVAWASLSVQIVPTEQEKQQRREAAKQCELFNLPEPEPPPLLHPLGGRRLPVERFWFWSSRPSKRDRGGAFSGAVNTGGFKSSAAAAPGSAAAT